jgi:hypothetical protein
VPSPALFHPPPAKRSVHLSAHSAFQSLIPGPVGVSVVPRGSRRGRCGTRPGFFVAWPPYASPIRASHGGHGASDPTACGCGVYLNLLVRPAQLACIGQQAFEDFGTSVLMHKGRVIEDCQRLTDERNAAKTCNEWWFVLSGHAHFQTAKGLSSGVCVVVRYFARILPAVVWCLAARVLRSERSITQCTSDRSATLWASK